MTRSKTADAIFLKQVKVIAQESTLKVALERKSGRRVAVAFNSSFSSKGCLGKRCSAMDVLVIIRKEVTRDAICMLEGCLSVRLKMMNRVRIV